MDFIRRLSGSDDALEYFADIFKRAEVLGDFPAYTRQDSVRLILKPLIDDTRPVGVFRCLFRLWAGQG